MIHLPTTMATTCFVCDMEVTDGVFITLGETFFTKTIFLNKISELVGDDFLVIAREEDQLCKGCASLLNKSDKLEVDLMETHNVIKRFLDFKYNLVPKEDNCSESDIVGLECSKDDNESGDFEFMECPPMENLIPSHDDENITNLESKNSGETSESKEEAQKSSVKPSPIFHDEEDNVKLENKQSTQNSVQNEEVREGVKQEKHCCDEENNVKLHKKQTTQYTVHKEDLREEDNEKCIKIKTEIDSHPPPKTYKPLLPKIVKGDDLIKLASFCVYEPVDPSRIIKINKLESDEVGKQYVEIVSASLDNYNLHDAAPNQNISNNVGKNGGRDSHSSEIYKCDICGKECSTKNRLDMHKTIHEKKVCDFCGRTFNNNYRLKVHRNIHTKQKKFTCDICGKFFIHHSTYWYHRKWHDEPYPFTCEFCSRPFRHNSMLAIHRRKHTGERPYKCSYCPLTFTISTTMKNHEMLHTQEYTFTCNTCLKGFTTRSKYEYHMAKNHNKIDGDGNVPKRRRRGATVKSDNKQKSQSKSSDSCPPVSGENSDQYLPLELGDGVEIVVGTEQIRKYNDISVDIIKKENSQIVGEWVVNESVNTNQDFPIELSEAVVEVVLGPEEIVFSEDMIITDNLISQIGS